MKTGVERLPIPILMADDDPDDRMLTREALEESMAAMDLHCVADGEELLDYLKRRGPYAAAEASPRPRLILLDLNMPRKSGREALKEIKTDPELCQIPVIVLTTSQAEEDVQNAYELGANSYISKPVTFEGLVEVMRSLKHYWFDIVAVPRSVASH